MRKCLFAMASLFAVESGPIPPGNTESALERARALAALAPEPKAQVNGEFESHGWWEAHSELFRDALREWGPKHEELYKFDATFEDLFIDERLRVAARNAYTSASTLEPQPENLAAAEAAVRALAVPTAAPGVWRVPFFSPRFCAALLEELDHAERSGVPLRRPNGMNRYGAMLEELGLSGAIRGASLKYLRPFAQLLLPSVAVAADFDEFYSFVVRYKLGEDVELKNHADASTITLNVCLGTEFEGSALRFGKFRFLDYPNGEETARVDAAPRDVTFTSSEGPGFDFGSALIHAGQHEHAATPLTKGARSNLVIWCYGSHGVVRVVRYPEHEQSTAFTRWGGHDQPANCLVNFP
mmetsp:Transcript_67527/g.152815  ORF Transcript_67527/g.152815 Transcript_67527/m.152815 type:complete len:355 (-) Transcript_67527:272-1336(-)